MTPIKAQFCKHKIVESLSRTDFTNHLLKSIMTLLIPEILQALQKYLQTEVLMQKGSLPKALE